MTNVASLEQVTKRYGERVVLDRVTIGVADGERVGVIGLNGSGKSTLLRLVAGVDEPEGGRVVHRSGIRVHYLGQEPDLDPADSAVGAVLSGETPVARAAQAFERATAAVRERPEDPRVHDRLHAATRDMDAAGAWDLEHRARALLDRLGLPDVDEPIGYRSGGERMRVALARALIDDAELLILDEPTNHLDAEVIDWLEDELRAWPGALVFVTHDRYLLDRVATRIAEVHRGQLYDHHGSYSDYLEARELRRQQAEAAERRRRNRARTELAWLRRGPKARTSKPKARIEQAEAVLADTPPDDDEQLRIELPARRIGSKVVDLHNAGKRYGNRWVLRGVDLKLAAGDRVGVVGPNGSGKTTLLGLVAGQVEPDEGSVRAGETVHIGWYGQDAENLPAGTRVHEAVDEVARETSLVDGLQVSASTLLERFLFDSSAQRAYVEELSGGERRRLELLRVLADAPNVLLLDEPTNDLDLDTLGTLEAYLDTWPGTLVVASHDRFFLDRTCSDVVSVEDDGRLAHHPGGWTAYRDRRASQQRAERTRQADQRQDQRQAQGSRPRDRHHTRKLSYNERRELALLEERLPELEARKDELEEAVQAAGEDYEEASRLGEELAAVVTELSQAEERWLELSTWETG